MKKEPSYTEGLRLVRLLDSPAEAKRIMRFNAKKLLRIHRRDEHANPPFNIQQIAGLRRVLEINEEPLSSPAKLLPVPGGFTISVRELESRARKNFSIAHEIGHTFFYVEIEKRPRMCHIDPHQRPLVEKMCDIFAAEVLMPALEFEASWDRFIDRLSISALEALAGQFGASVEATIVRAATLSLDVPEGCAIGVLKSIREIDECHSSARLASCVCDRRLSLKDKPEIVLVRCEKAELGKADSSRLEEFQLESKEEEFRLRLPTELKRYGSYYSVFITKGS